MIWYEEVLCLTVGALLGFCLGVAYVSHKDKELEALFDEMEELEYLPNLNHMR